MLDDNEAGKRWLVGERQLKRTRRVLEGLIAAAAVTILVVALASCAQTGSSTPAAESASPARAASEPAKAAPNLANFAIDNVFQPRAGVYCGAAPLTETAFDALTILGGSGGVKTIVSVDGAQPDIERARERGMRYVHIPIGYDGVDDGSRAQLAAAIRDLPRPIYIHCHHGKHRGPAATAAGLIAAGEMTPDVGVGLMLMAGTSNAYPGLYRDVNASTRLDEATIDAALFELVERQEMSGLVATMVEVELAFERLDLTREAGWVAPADHPDLAPAAEAGMIHDLLANLAAAPESTNEPAEFQELLAESIDEVVGLERQLAFRKPGQQWSLAEDAEFTSRFWAIKQTCVKCHLHFRNR